MTRTVIELSHPIEDGMPTYPGLPTPKIDLHLDHVASRAAYDGRAEFAIGRLQLVGNTATYLDSPYHRYPDGPDIAALPLDRLVGLPTTVVDATGTGTSTVGRCLELHLPTSDLRDRAVLVHTGWSDRWGSDAYWHPGPYLGSETVTQLLASPPALVGVDCWNVDDPDDPARPVHTALLGAGIPIVEHLHGLQRIPVGATTSFVPLAVRGAPSLPIRAFAVAPW